jgi:hypothetical protein
MRTTTTRTMTSTAALLLPLLAVTASTEAAPASSGDGCTLFSQDFDDDGKRDDVHPLPDRTIDGVKNAGAVVVKLTASEPVVLTRRSLGLGAPRRGDRFGHVTRVHHVDGNGDDCPRLLITAPGLRGRGAVVVVETTPTGISGKGIALAPRGLRSGDEFGASLGAQIVGDDECDYLPVGAPGTDVGGARDAGAVHFVGLLCAPEEDEGYSQAPALTSWTQDSPGTPDRAEAGDRFGESVDGRWAGAPGEDVGGRRDAGAVFVRCGSTESSMLRPGRAGLPGRPQSGARFGHLVHNANRPVIGAPGERVGSAARAGAVYAGPPTGNSVPGRSGWQRLHLNSPSVAGKAARGDGFGSAFTQIVSTTIDQPVRRPAVGIMEGLLFVGIPGKQVAGRRNAGAVVTIDITKPFFLDPEAPAYQPAVGKLLRQGRGGVPGRPERGDRFGAAFGLQPRDLFPGTGEIVHIGAPGEDSRGRDDVGWVWSNSSGQTSLGIRQRAGDRFGNAN